MEKEIGVIEHFFGHLSVAALKLTDGTLKVGDTIHVKGHTTDFTEKIKSMQIDNNDVQEAKPGDDVGIKMEGKCREHDVVYLVTE
jgi:translation initiation factor IF-2